MKRRVAIFAILSAVAIWPAVGIPSDPAVTRATYQVLNQARELMDHDAHTEAVVILQKALVSRPGTDHDTAMLLQYLGYAQLGLHRHGPAIDAFEGALQKATLPPDDTRQLWYLLGQLYVQEEAFKNAIGAFESMFKIALPPHPEQARAHGWAAYAHYRLGNSARAIDHARSAISQSDKPETAWYRILAASHMQRGEYREAEAPLKALIRINPKEQSHWEQLAYTYLQRDRRQAALATYALAYRLGHIDPADLLQFARLHAASGIPEHGARLMSTWLDDGRLAASHENLTLTAELWLMARENKMAIGPLTRAVPLAKDGTTAERLGNLYYESGQWDSAANAFERALAEGGLKNAARTALLLAISACESGDYRSADRALQQAGRDPKLAPQVSYWQEVLARKRGDRDRG
ncbi:MAG: tetratricopeptide repeat protein [Pseudomonadota bacterium]|nr:tetratricopeptide repeat protein [Pseudomonadota bacterium]